MNSIQTIEVNLPFIPQNHVISKKEIESLTFNQILQLQQYVDVTFPEFTYSDLDNIITSCIIMGNRIPADSVILCPGDSPYKISYLIEYIFNSKWNMLTYDSSITSNGVTFSYPMRKYVKFVRFPISSLSGREINLELLDEYIWKQELYYDVRNKLNIGIMDYSESGGTVDILTKSLERVYGVEEVTNYDVWDSYREVFHSEKDIKQHNRTFFFGIIAEAERTDCRCQSKYKIGENEIDYNPYRCNAIIALIYLRFLDRLDRNYEWLPRTIVNIDNKSNYIVTYYDTSTLTTNTIEVAGSLIYNNRIWIPGKDNILMNTVYSIKEI